MEKITEDIIKVDGDACLSDIYAELEDYELFIEPLSFEKSLNDFVFEGGLGYGSLHEGSFASKIFQMKFKTPQGSFRYGLNCSTLYGAGYPLHRITENSPHKICPQSFTKIEELLIPVRKKEKFKITYQPVEISQFYLPPMAQNAFFVNDYGASLLGLERRGLVTTYKEGFSGKGEVRDDIWEKRFIEDNLPVEHKTVKVLTTKSNVPKIHELFAVNGNMLFFALFTHLGILVLLSGTDIQIEEQIEDMTLTYLLNSKVRNK